jgi:excisionase family DNA binding protein
MRTTPERAGVREVVVREVMDIRMASDYLGISPDTLYKYASDGFVPAFKLGNRWRFKRSRLDDWMDQQSSEGALPRKMEPQPEVSQARKPQSVPSRPKRAIAAAR